MKYLCLAYYDPAKFAALPKAQMDGIVAQCKQYDEALKKTGKLVLHGSLEEPATGRAIRPKRGKVSVTDGPYAEAKEVVGGFFMIEAGDREDAIRVASNHPAAHLGEEVGWGIEVRQVDYFEAFPR